MLHENWMAVSPEALLSRAGFRLEAVETDKAIIYVLQSDLRVIYCNEAWDRFAKENGGERLIRSAIVGTPVLDAIPESLKAYYKRGFAQARLLGQPWEHDFECSTAELFRVFRMRVLPLADSCFMVENSLRLEQVHGHDRPPMPPQVAIYQDDHEIVTLCCHCRRTRRAGVINDPVWDWVPSFLAYPPKMISHGLCSNCRAYFYSGDADKGVNSWRNPITRL